MNHMKENPDLIAGTEIGELFLSANLRDDGCTKWYNLHLGREGGNMIRITNLPSHTDAIIKVRENYEDYLARLKHSNMDSLYLRTHHTRNE